MEITITFKGVELDVDFDYQPAEAMVMYYTDGSGYPGCPATVEQINSVYFMDVDFTEFFENEDEELEEAILEALEEQGDL